VHPGQKFSEILAVAAPGLQHPRASGSARLRRTGCEGVQSPFRWPRGPPPDPGPGPPNIGAVSGFPSADGAPSHRSRQLTTAWRSKAGVPDGVGGSRRMMAWMVRCARLTIPVLVMVRSLARAALPTVIDIVV
jgi:hypothetical protein